MKLYDDALVSLIRNKTYTTRIDGEEIIMKPVPDDDREHVMDPRVVETTKIKMNVKALDKKAKFSLYGQRVRPDKVSYDITSTNVTESEDLVEINGTHYIDVYTFTPVDFAPGRAVLLYLHGGGYMTGDVAEFRMAMRFVAEQSGCKVIFPEYRLAPENPFPAGVDDCHAMVEWIYEHADELQVDKNKIVVSGDSAGGGLTNSCLVLDKELHHIAYAYEFYSGFMMDFPQYDGVDTMDIFEAIDKHKIYAKNRVDRIRYAGVMDYYLHGKIDAHDPVVCITSCPDLSWLPDMTVVCGEYDWLRLSNDAFVKRVRAEGVNIRNLRYLGCDHGFMEKVGVLPQAEEVLLDLADVLKNL
ncbi:MAG: alpha/beta hydrolase fold domain-containing protein [Erysipelotrichaceae bacterium]|nr:alpha/beta hydrolase fold domain-containing protein [Erysipelotrichaceae bacterium]